MIDFTDEYDEDPEGYYLHEDLAKDVTGLICKSCHAEVALFGNDFLDSLATVARIEIFTQGYLLQHRQMGQCDA